MSYHWKFFSCIWGNDSGVVSLEGVHRFSSNKLFCRAQKQDAYENLFCHWKKIVSIWGIDSGVVSPEGVNRFTSNKIFSRAQKYLYSGDDDDIWPCYIYGVANLASLEARMATRFRHEEWTTKFCFRAHK